VSARLAHFTQADGHRVRLKGPPTATDTRSERHICGWKLAMAVNGMCAAGVGLERTGPFSFGREAIARRLYYFTLVSRPGGGAI
jgi:hypothetical protein